MLPSKKLPPVAAPSAVRIPLGAVVLDGLLSVPVEATGVVLFAHGSGSSRLSPRNRYVAEALHHAGIATLLFDLLTPLEANDRRKVFDVKLLGARLRGATAWIRRHPASQRFGIGYFGASTGAAAALIAAAADDTIQAVVSRGGRPDLAADALAAVRAPTLLIVGSFDSVVLDLNREAYDRLRCEKRLAIVEGATHLFEEPGTLDRVVHRAIDWFAEYLRANGRDEAADDLRRP